MDDRAKPEANVIGNHGNSVETKAFECFLDLARGLAAITVFASHLRVPLFRGYPALPSEQQVWWVQLWYFVTGFGFEAVVVFFVLSGYLVAGFGAGRLKAGTFRPTDYFIDRFSRLYVVLIPALVLTVLFDALGDRFTTTGFWSAANPVVLEKFQNSFIAADTPAIFLCNAVMLQSFACPVLGSNIPLWTLSFEFWFYICFGIFALSVLYPAGRWLGAIFLMSALALLGYGFILMLTVWLMGLAAFLVRPRPRLAAPILSLGCFLAVLVVSRFVGTGKPVAGVQDLVIIALGLSFTWVLLSFREKSPTWLARIQWPAANLAGYSYSLYIIHFPTMLLVIGLLDTLGWSGGANGFDPSGAAGVLTYFGVFAATLLFAYVFAWVTEARTADVRRWARERARRLRTA